MKKSLFIGVKQWSRELRNWDFWIVLLCLFTFLSINYYDSGCILFEIGDKIGVFSLLPIMLADWTFCLIIYAGFLMIICEIPLRKKGLTFEVLRMNRLSWFFGQIVYGLLMSITYFFFVMLIGISFFVRSVSFTTEWGTAVEEGTAFMGELGMIFPSNLLEMNAARVCLQAFVLAVLLGVLLGMICCVCNMLTEKGIGLAICGVLIIIQRFADGWELSFRNILPLGMLTGFYTSQGTNIIPAVCYYVFCITLLVMIRYYILYKPDRSENR